MTLLTDRIAALVPNCLHCGSSLQGCWDGPDCRCACRCEHPRYLRAPVHADALRGLDVALVDALEERLGSVPPESRKIFCAMMDIIQWTVVHQEVPLYTAMDERRRALLWDCGFRSLGEYRATMAQLFADDASIEDMFRVDGSMFGALADLDIALSTVEIFFCPDTTILPEDVQLCTVLAKKKINQEYGANHG